MTAGLCVLQAFKVLQNDIANAKMVKSFMIVLTMMDVANIWFFIQVFLERSGTRVISSDILQPPNRDCPVCSVVHGQVTVDHERATLQDLVEGVLRLELGYGEELSVIKGEEVIYDPEMDDVLPKKLADLGIKNETFITVRDEDDLGKNPRVNLQLEVLDR